MSATRRSAGSAALGVHPVTLSFRTPQFESAYASNRTAYLSEASDQAILGVTFCFTLVFLSAQVLGEATAPHLACGLCSLALCGAQWLLMRAQGGEQWLEKRQKYLPRIRLLKLVVFVMGARLANAQGTDAAAGCVLHSLMLRSGVLCQLWLALTAPLLFRTHLWVQGLGTGLTMFFFSGRTCAKVLESQGGKDAVRWMWHQVDASVSTYARLDDSVLGMKMYSPEPQACCLQIVILMHLAIGFLAPSLVLYIWELKSRKSYLLKHLRKTGDVGEAMKAHSVPDAAQMGAIFLSSTALLWIPLRFL